MRLLRTILFVAVLFCLSTAVYAQNCDTFPNLGTYSTYTSTLLPGRASESWCNAPTNGGVPGNTQNAASWDGVTLGGEWKVWGMSIDATGAVETSRSIDAYGNGWIDYETAYDGGQFWFSKDHACSDGINDLTGVVENFNVGARVTLIGGVAVQLTSNIFFTGYFDDCPLCTLEYTIANAMRVWVTGDGNMPADFPEFLCGATSGELFDVCCATAHIFCPPVAADESSWGSIKQLHN